MSIQTLTNTIRTRVKTKVEDVLNIPVAYPNAQFTIPTDNSKRWIRATINFSSRERMSLGGPSARFRRRGILTLQLFLPPETGESQAYEDADIIEAAFEAVTVSGVSFRTPNTTVLGVNQGWFQCNIDCPFEHDETV